MLSAEPAPTQFDLRFNLLGFPVRVHPMFWLVSVIMGMGGSTGGDPALVLTWVIASFISILIHELGHAVAVRYHGWDCWITLHGFGGLASYRPSYHNPRTQILISLAGPFAGFLLAAVIVACLYATNHPVTFQFGGPGLLAWDIDIDGNSKLRLWLFVRYMLFINIWWGLVNLLPILPLDGGHVAQELLQQSRPRDGLKLTLQLSIACGIAVAVYSAITLDDKYMALMFGYLAFTNYQTLQAYSGRGGGGWQ